MLFIAQGKTNIKYILIVVILAVIVGGGILAYQYWWVPKEEVKAPELKLPEKVKDETANWNLYNEYSFFSLRYPPGWVVKDNLDETSIKTHTSGPNSFLEISNPAIPEQPRLVLYINPSGFGEFAPEITYLLEITDENEVRIVEREEHSYEGTPFQSETREIATLLPLGQTFGGNVYWFHFYFQKGGQDLEPVFRKILSTFRFVKTTEEFCGWSTNGSCSSDSDCMAGGCSGQVCQSRNEEGIITTCEYKECYSAENYGLSCECSNNKCQWSK